MAVNRNSKIRLSFYGAAMTVTGSKYLLEYDGGKILVDCGLFQGKKELRLRNWDKPPFDPKALSAVVLTHAHIDHIGYLPRIVKAGFRGPVFCTPATIELAKLLLPDSAYLQEEEARYANEKGSSKHHPALPLYNQADAKEALKYLKPIPRGASTEILPGVVVTTACAGHILGSAILNFDIGGRRVTFSGDIGRYDTPLLPDPQGVALGDIFLCESTYGDRVHADGDMKAELAAVVNKAVDKKGAILIPAFAVGRTQTLLYYLSELEREGKIPTLPVFVDSPMAVDATQIYMDFRHDYDDEAAAILKEGGRPLRTQNTSFCSSVDQSKALNRLKGPRIIIAASGMITGGRVVHHVSQLAGDENNTILFVGFQGEGTRGRLIQSGAKEIKMFGRYVEIRAHVETISGLSAHGDRGELLRWISSCSGSPQVVKIVHGEPEASRAFAEAVQQQFGWNTSQAQYLETVEV